MKFLLALAISVTLALATSPLLSTDEPQAVAQNAQAAVKNNPFQPPPFSLETTEMDGFERAKFKAALRLLNAYTVTINQLRGCAAASNDPGINKALTNFHGRNGMVMNHVMMVVKKNGGLSQEVRIKLDERAAELMASDPRRGNCPAIVARINSGGEDLYKAPQYIDDYKTLRAATAD